MWISPVRVHSLWAGPYPEKVVNKEINLYKREWSKISSFSLYLHQTSHSNLSPFSASKCPSMMVSISEIVTPYTLKELFHSALPWEYNVYVPRARRSNCVATNILTQGQYLNRHGSGLLKQKIQRVHTFTHTHTSNSPTRIPLVVGYHPAIQSMSSIFTKS